MADRHNRHLDLESDFAASPVTHTQRDQFKFDSLKLNSSGEHPIYLEGDATVWDDLRTPSNTSKAVAGKEATDVAYRGGVVTAFASNTDQAVSFNVQLPHSYKLGEDIEFHIHMVIPTAGSGGADENVKFDFTHSWADIGSAFPVATEVTATRNVKDDSADTHYLFEIAGTIDGSAISIVSSMIICSLTRDVSVTNDYAHAVYITELDFHYPIDSMGSRTEASK